MESGRCESSQLLTLDKAVEGAADGGGYRLYEGVRQVIQDAGHDESIQEWHVTGVADTYYAASLQSKFRKVQERCG